jgi:hypothetical protein
MGVAETTPVWPGSSSTFSFFFLFSLFDLVGRPNHFHEPQGWFSHPKRPNPLLLFFSFFFFFCFLALWGGRTTLMCHGGSSATPKPVMGVVQPPLHIYFLKYIFNFSLIFKI